MASRVPAVEAAELVSQKGYKYLDVRTPEEYAAGHPQGSVNIPLMLKTDGGMVPNPDFMQKVKETFTDSTCPLVVGCKAGNRSARACTLLHTENFTNIVDNAGGFDGWVAGNLPTEK